MTESDIADVLSRASAASNGPFEERTNTDDGARVVFSKEETTHFVINAWRGREQAVADAQFYAHARDDVFALAAEIARLKAPLDTPICEGYDQGKDPLDRYCDRCGGTLAEHAKMEARVNL